MIRPSRSKWDKMQEVAEDCYLKAKEKRREAELMLVEVENLQADADEYEARGMNLEYEIHNTETE